MGAYGCSEEGRGNSGSDVNSRAVVVVNKSEGPEFEKADTECSSQISGNLSKDDTMSNRESCVSDRTTSSTGFVTMTV